MAEIHVEKKRGVAGWIWVLLIVVLIAAAIWYLWQAGYVGVGPDRVSLFQTVAPIAGGTNGT
ncbi:MAG: hypothetical protein ACT443_08675 [Gemmatimonadota bacterium]